MDNRFPNRSRYSTRTVSSAAYDDDRSARYSGTSIPTQRTSVAFSTHNVVIEPEHARENVFATPPGSRSPSPSRSNVFATPTNSTPSSPTTSTVDVNVFGTPTPSLYRNSLSSSIRRTPSPLPIADGGRPGGYFGHQRTFSMPRSLTPSLASSSNGYSGLNRSNTTATNTTSNSSTVYSIPSHSSQFSAPPSPIPSIAPVRPQFNYGGHQQTLSLHGSDLDEDPFGDGFVVPVGDGFAPRAQRPADLSSNNETRSVDPPPYTRYPDQPRSPKPEDDPFGVMRLRPVSSNPDSGVSLSSTEGEERRNIQGLVVAPAAAGAMEGTPENEDTSGAAKEWRGKRWGGLRLWVIITAGIALLLVGLVVGLGVGLGIGLRRAKNHHGPIPITKVSTYVMPPSPEQTGPAETDPNTIYPNIPTGVSKLYPLNLTSSQPSCAISVNSTNPPEYFDEYVAHSLFSCTIPSDNPLTWDVEPWPSSLPGEQAITALDSDPDTLTTSDMHGLWGGYIISSQEGNKAKENPVVVVDGDGDTLHLSATNQWVEGMQGPEFWRQPLGLFNHTNGTDDFGVIYKRDDDDDSYSNSSYPIRSYKFGILYNKTVVLKDTTLRATSSSKGANPAQQGNGTRLVQGDLAWMCIWEKTLLEVEIMVDILSIAENYGEKSIVGDDRADPDNDGNPTPVTTITSTWDPDTYSSTSSFKIIPSIHASDSVKASTSCSTSSSYSSSYTSPYSSPYQPLPTPFNPDPNNRHGSDGDEYLPDPPPLPGPPFDLPPPTPVMPDLPYPFPAPTTAIRRALFERSIRKYPQQVRIKESRPSKDRLKQVLGISLSDSDDDGRSAPGAVTCKRMIMVDDYAMKEDPGDGDGVVTFQEQQVVESYHKSDDDDDDDDDDDNYSDSDKRERRKRTNYDNHAECYCAWGS